MLLLFVAGIIAMLSLPLPGVGAADDRDALLYKVKILIPPKEVRDETADVQQIKQTVEDLKDIKVIFAFKELATPRIFLDFSTLEYNGRLKMTFEEDLAILKTGQKGVCFRILAEYPVELVYFAQVSQTQIEAYEEMLQAPGIDENEIRRIENLANYTAVCQGD